MVKKISKPIFVFAMCFVNEIAQCNEFNSSDTHKVNPSMGQKNIIILRPIAKLEDEKINNDEIAKADASKPSDDRFAEQDKKRKKDGLPSLVLVNELAEQIANTISSINNQGLKRLVNYSVEPLFTSEPTGIQPAIFIRLSSFKDVKAAAEKFINLAKDIEKMGEGYAKEFPCTDEQLKDEAKFSFVKKDNFSVKELLMKTKKFSNDEALSVEKYFEGLVPNMAKAELCNDAASLCYSKRKTDFHSTALKYFESLEAQMLKENNKMFETLPVRVLMSEMLLALLPLYRHEYSIMCRNFSLRADLELAILRKKIDQHPELVKGFVENLCRNRGQAYRDFLGGVCTFFEGELLLSKNIQKAASEIGN